MILGRDDEEAGRIDSRGQRARDGRSFARPPCCRASWLRLRDKRVSRVATQRGWWRICVGQQAPPPPVHGAGSDGPGRVRVRRRLLSVTAVN